MATSAVFRSGGKQYRVSPGDVVRLAKLAGAPGDSVTFPEVLHVSGEAPRVGTPLVQGAAVKGEIVAQDRGPKLVVFKFLKRKRMHKKQGHRQDYTAVKITGIEG